MDPVLPSSRLVNRNIVAASGRSSMRLEPEIWDALFEICRREDIAMADLVRKVDGGREVGGRTSAIRVYAFNYFRDAATEDGHRRAGHGSRAEHDDEDDAPAAEPALIRQLGPV
jgi:predicted DNA-binding ribbon-helix-helix protein